MICRYKIKFISDIEQKIRKLLVNIAVAPFVGVWIEICRALGIDPDTSSLPSWECGLKSKRLIIFRFLKNVAPFVGVWIEMCILFVLPVEDTSRSLRGSVD